MNSIAWLFPWLFSGFLTKLTHFFFFPQLQFCVILFFRDSLILLPPFLWFLLLSPFQPSVTQRVILFPPLSPSPSFSLPAFLWRGVTEETTATPLIGFYQITHGRCATASDLAVCCSQGRGVRIPLTLPANQPPLPANQSRPPLPLLSSTCLLFWPSQGPGNRMVIWPHGLFPSKTSSSRIFMIQ